MLVATIAAATLAAQFIAPRSLASTLAASVKANTGRELSFADVKIRLLPRPALLVSELRLGNAGWATPPWLAEVDRVSVEFDLLALLAGRLHARQVALSGMRVGLETNADGVGNWLIGSAAASAPEWLKALSIDEVALETVALTYRRGPIGTTSSALLDAVRIEQPLAPHAIRLSARATVDGRRVEAAATIGALAALLANAPAYPVDLAVSVDGARLNASGAIDQPLGPGVLNLTLSVEAPEFDELAALFGVNTPPLGAVRGSASLTGTPSAAGLSAIDIAIGGSGRPELTLRGAVAQWRAVRGIDLYLTATATDWWHWSAEIDPPPEVSPGLAAGFPPGFPPVFPPFSASARLRDSASGYHVDDLELSVADSRVGASLQAERSGPRLRVSGQLAAPLIDLARLAPRSPQPAGAAKPRARNYWTLADQYLDLDLRLAIGRLVLPDGRLLQSANGRLALAGGRLKASALQLTLGGARVTIDGSVTDPQRLAGIDLDVALQGSELAELSAFFGRSLPPLGGYQGRMHLSGSSAALRASAIDATVGRAAQQLQVSGRIDDLLGRRALALAVTADVSDSVAAGRLFGVALPRLPRWRASARLSDVAGDYRLDTLTLALGRTSLQGSVVFANSAPRPRLSAKLSGPRVDLAELLPARPGANPLTAADAAKIVDLDATLHIDQLLLPNRRALGPLHGEARLIAGALELKQFSVAVDGAAATFDGRIGDPLTMASLDLMVHASLTHSAGLAALSALSLPAIPAFTASGRLSEVPDGYRLTGLTLKHAATTISGDLAVTRGTRRLKVVAELASALLDLSQFTLPAAKTRASPAPAARTRLLSDRALPIDLLKRIDGQFEFNFAALKLGDTAPLGPLRVLARIEDGQLDAGPLQLAVAPGQIVNASAKIAADGAAWTARVEATGIDLGQLLARAGRPELITGGRSDLAVQLGGRGKSLAALIGSLDGELRLKVGALRAHNVAANLGEGLLTRTLGLINPFLKSDPDTEVSCIAARLPIKRGVLSSERHLAVETAKYNAVVSGSLDLASERLDLAVLPIVKSGRAIGAGELTSIVRLRGTLVEPALAVDAVGVAKSAASLGAAVATLGGWWLADALLKQVKADPSPCATALAR